MPSAKTFLGFVHQIMSIRRPQPAINLTARSNGLMWQSVRMLCRCGLYLPNPSCRRYQIFRIRLNNNTPPLRGKELLRKTVASRGYHDLVPTFGVCSRQCHANRHLNSIVSVLSFCFNPPFAISQPRIDLQAAHRDCCSNQDAFCAIRACQVTSALIPQFARLRDSLGREWPHLLGNSR